MIDRCGVCRMALGTPDSPALCKCPSCAPRPDIDYVDALTRDTLSIAHDISQMSASQRGKTRGRPRRHMALAISRDVTADFAEPNSSIDVSEVSDGL